MVSPALPLVLPIWLVPFPVELVGHETLPSGGERWEAQWGAVFWSFGWRTFFLKGSFLNVGKADRLPRKAVTPTQSLGLCHRCNPWRLHVPPSLRLLTQAPGPGCWLHLAHLPIQHLVSFLRLPSQSTTNGVKTIEIRPIQGLKPVILAIGEAWDWEDYGSRQKSSWDAISTNSWVWVVCTCQSVMAGNLKQEITV